MAADSVLDEDVGWGGAHHHWSNHYLDVEWLKAAYERVKPDSAPGVDGQSWSDYGKELEKNLQSLLNLAKSGSYARRRSNGCISRRATARRLDQLGC